MMLLWNGLHSYNAVHVARLAGPLDAQRLGRCINDRVERMGIGGVELDMPRCRFRLTAAPGDVPLRIVQPDGDPAAALRATVTEELNTPFSLEGCFTPVRFFAVPDSEDFQLGVVYCHFISDAASIVTVLTDVCEAWAGREGEPALQADRGYPNVGRRMAALMLRHGPMWAASHPLHIAGMFRAAKPKFARYRDHAIGYSFFRVNREQFPGVISTARAWGVTVNDLFLAALVRAVAPSAEPRMKGRRRNINLSSIVSTRQDLWGGNMTDLGLLLGSFVVAHRAPGDAPLEQVARKIGRQTRFIKKHRLYLRTHVDMRIALGVLGRMGSVRQQRMFKHNYPLWGGIANVNLNWLSERNAGGPILDYRRAVSTGPICPLVLSVTTYNDVINVGVSYRETIYPADKAATIIDELTRCLSDPQHA